MDAFIDPAVEKYMYNILPERDEVLLEMEDQARKRQIPIIGPAAKPRRRCAICW